MGSQTHVSSLIELLHPSGAPEVVRVIGSGCPEEATLCPKRRDAGALAADLIVLAPSPEEGADRRWLREAVEEAHRLLERDGVLYVLADRRWRGHALRLLAGCGLEVEDVYFHHPRWPQTELLIPVAYETIEYAYSRLIHTNPRRRRLALAALAAPGVLAAARHLLPQTGIVARHKGSRASLAWLAGEGGNGHRTIAQASWRGPNGAVLLHAFDEKLRPSAVAKAWLSENRSMSFHEEIAGLELARVTAADAGAAVPRLLRRGTITRFPYLVESVVAGEKAAEVLGREPARLAAVLTKVADWLGKWSARTARVHSFTDEEIDRLALAPARELSTALAVGSHYEARLQALGRRLREGPARTVAAHGDLTMVNVLLDEDGGMGVIDWESASTDGLPLADWFYAAVDAVAATDGYQDRVGAWESCFAPRGSYRDLVSRLQAKVEDTVEISPDLLTFSFHVCWLHHALRERRETAKTEPDEFLRIAKLAACSLLNRAEGLGGP